MAPTTPASPSSDRLALLYRLSQTFNSSLDLDEVLNRVMDEVVAATRAERGFVMLRQADGSLLFCVARGMDQETIDDPQFQVSRSVVEQVAREGQPVQTSDAQLDDRFSSRTSVQGLRLRSILCVPLKHKDQVSGVVYVDNRLQVDVFTPADLELLTAIASSAAIAIENARLFDQVQRHAEKLAQREGELQHSLQRLQRTLRGTVNALASAVGGRDPYTAGHQRRVAQLASAIAETLGLSEEQVEGVWVTSLIHDIGKINVPAEILSKPGRITDLEFALIKTHVQAGHDILQAVEFPWPVAQIVLQHHEKLDGSGYPAGLSGSDILLEAQILGVADVVEAISSHRPYRAAIGVQEALAEIERHAGQLYDPTVVDACLRLFRERGFRFEPG